MGCRCAREGERMGAAGDPVVNEQPKIHPEGPKRGAAGGDFTCHWPRFQPGMSLRRHQGGHLMYSPPNYLVVVKGEESWPKRHLFSWH